MGSLTTVDKLVIVYRVFNVCTWMKKKIITKLKGLEEGFKAVN